MTLPGVTGELVRHGDRVWTVDAPVTLSWSGPVFVLDGEYVLPSDESGRPLDGRDVCWLLSSSDGPSWLVECDGPIGVRFSDGSAEVLLDAPAARLIEHRALPHADVKGNEFVLDFAGGDLLADALAGFYWRTMLPCVVERTRASALADSGGYVLSTLASTYAGTYPDVDHEFQIKGRIAWGDALDLAVVRRMIELQLRLMREDPEQLWRDPCAVQPSGEREYHVRRSSLDGSANATMFLVTGNVEVIESAWLYVARTNDLGWLRDHIADLEGAASFVESCVDGLGRLWSDVYYEDQVIKDGRETMAAALALRSFDLLASLEDLLGRDHTYRELRDRLAAALVAPLPLGHWDPVEQRFVDWVDRSGRPHDHMHLLANILPVLVGAASLEQAAGVEAMVAREFDEFQRFPTFLSARIADYTDDEIGDGGPYDLCAAGRYWCWDAAYWSSLGASAVLRDQLDRVARQGAADGYVMGERYDMQHVYYVDDKVWHGAAHYYEYPCVFSWVLITEYLGVRPTLEADLLIAPRVTGSVTLRQDAYRLRYAADDQGLTVTNLADTERTFLVSLPAGSRRRVTIAAGASVLVQNTPV